MAKIETDILGCIGDTRMVALRRIEVPNGVRVLLKLESENPTGSMKDRMALAMVEAAEKDGRLAPGGAVVEYTGGSTGVSLALVCAVKGHPFYVVSSDAFAREKLDHMRLLGAELTIIPSESGRMTGKLTNDMVAAARDIAERTGAFMTDQLRNPDPIAGYDRMAEEIWGQTEGGVTALIQAVGTAGSVRGLAEGLTRRAGFVKVFAVEPAESAVLSGEPSGAHKIDGVGVGFLPPLWRADLVDGIEKVSTVEANAMALRLAREEGIFAGSSTGANVIAALRLAERLEPGATIVTIACDTGMKYLKSFGAMV